MIPFDKKPFKGRTYFFDLRFYRNQDELIKNVKKLGAKVESFLSKDVSHVVTDRPLKVKDGSPATPKALFLTPSPVHDSGYVEFSGTQSPFTDAHTPTLMRGKALLQKAKQKNTGSADLFGFCVQWQIKIIPLQKLLDFILRFKTWSKQTRENKAPKEKEKASSTVKFFREVLKSPFIKIENINREFRPFYKAYKSLRNCFNPTFLRVVNRMQKKFTKSSSNINSVLKTSQVLNITNHAPSNSKSTKTKDDEQSTNSIYRGHRPSTAHSVKTTIKDKPKKTVKKRFEDKKHFCEICHLSFLSMEEHLSCPKHKFFMNNPKNFKIIEEVNFTLPTAEDFLRKVCLLAESSSTVSKETNANSSGISSMNVFADLTHNIITERDSHVMEKLFPADKSEIIDGSCDTDEHSDAYPFLKCMSPIPETKPDMTEFGADGNHGLPFNLLHDIIERVSKENNVSSVNNIPLHIPLVQEANFATPEPANVEVNDVLFCYESFEQHSPSANSLQAAMVLNPLAPMESRRKFGTTISNICNNVNDDAIGENKHPHMDKKVDSGSLEHGNICDYYDSEDFSGRTLSDGRVSPYVAIRPCTRHHSSSDVDSLNEVLNVHGCHIKKYPFRNFGYGTVPSSPIKLKISSPFKCSPIGTLKDILAANGTESEHPEGVLLQDTDNSHQAHAEEALDDLTVTVAPKDQLTES